MDQSSKRKGRDWAPMFEPNDFNRTNKPLMLDQYKLDSKVLLEYAQLCVTLRIRFLRRAIEVRSEPSVERTILDSLSQQRHELAGRRYTRKSNHYNVHNYKDPKEQTYPSLRCKKRRISELGIGDRLKIVYAVVIKKQGHVETAREHRVSVCTV